MDLVGELVIAHSIVEEDIRGTKQPTVQKKVHHTSEIIRDIQDLSLSLRMVPLGPTFQKMQRVVRDTAQRSGKQVELISSGEETEVDRTMVDIIADPLVHMMRNAVDHGIETPAAREESGKSPIGQIHLSACHAGGNVLVELRGDGAGLDRERILEKGIELGLVDSTKPLSDNEVFQLIFSPGFSTAEEVTDVSGRGVGMDVAFKNISRLKGRIDITSKAGRGTTFSVHVPLTLAITDGMLVRVGDERFIVPTASIDLSFRPTADLLHTVTDRGEMVRLRDSVMPIFRLHQLFGVTGATEDPTRGLLVVLGGDGAPRTAMLVDELVGQYQVVTKTLGAAIGLVPGVSGGAILGDGRVGLILDPPALIRLAQNSVYSPRRGLESLDMPTLH